MAKKSPAEPPKNVDLSELCYDNDQPNFLKQMQEDFRDLMGDKPVLRQAMETFLDEIVDQLTLGIIFDLHRKFKTKAYCLEVKENEKNEEDDEEQSEELTLSPVKSAPQKCICPNCEQQVAALRFARHLAKCMGVSDNSRSSRNASRRAATNKEKGESSSSSFSANSDDDDDEDWNPRKNRRKEKSVSPKKKGIPKKNNSDPDLIEAIYAGEALEEPTTSFRHVTRSNSSSPDSSSGSPKKREKFKKTSKGKERSSVSTSLKFD